MSWSSGERGVIEKDRISGMDEPGAFQIDFPCALLAASAECSGTAIPASG